MKRTDFEVLNEMSKENMDIKMSPNLLGAQAIDGGGAISMGVDSTTLLNLVSNPGDYYVVLYVVKKSQFDKLKKK